MILEPVEHNFVSDADCINFYAAKMYDAMSDFLEVKADFQLVVDCASILRQFKVDENLIDMVVRRAAQHDRFPFHLFKPVTA